MIPGDGKRSFVLSITLTEIALLLFFLLLTTAVGEIRGVNSERESLERDLDEIAERVGTSPAALRGLVQELAVADVERDSLRTRNEELTTQLAEVDRQRIGLEDILSRHADNSAGDDFKELLRAAASNMAAEHQRSQLQERISVLESESERLESTLADCSAQNLNCSRRLAEEGMGYPPCWADATGRPEYLFRVELRESTIEVVPTWPSHRIDEAGQIPGVADLAGRSVGVNEFGPLAQPILEWSQAQAPECRHFVTVEDAPDMSKAAFKENLLTVEHYFYKYLSRD